MYDFFLHSPLFTAFLMIGITFSVIYVNHGIWYIRDRRIKSSEASMDAYTKFYNHDTNAPDDREAEWLNEHEKTCKGTQGVLIRSQDETRNWTHLDVQKCCPECVNAWKTLYGAEPVVMPDFVDQRESVKAVFAQIPVRRASAA